MGDRSTSIKDLLSPSVPSGPKIAEEHAPLPVAPLPITPPPTVHYHNPPGSDSSFETMPPKLAGRPNDLTFLQKIRSDKYIMDLISVGTIVFLLSNSTVIGIIKTKFPSIYNNGNVTLQGNFLLSFMSVIALIIIRKLI